LKLIVLDLKDFLQVKMSVEPMNVDIASREEYLRQKKKDTLKKLDDAKFGWFHVRAILVSGIGFFTVRTMNLSLRSFPNSIKL
jgi:hypothetical protein